MSKILVLNSGSSSVKYQLFEAEGEHFSVLAKGMVERIGLPNSVISYSNGTDPKKSKIMDFPNHDEAIKELLRVLLKYNLKSLDELAAVGHRMGHGGEYFDKSVFIDDDVRKKIYDAVELIPLHGPALILGMEAITRILPDIKQVAAFDTAYHQTMPKEAFLYALPIEQYEKHKIRKYGFHGTSHAYIAQRTEEILGYKGKFISCHLGSGASVTAIKDGKSVDTTMGFTPMVGMIMGTRCGDIDAYLPFHIMKTQNKTMHEVNMMLNKESGLLGLSGYQDMREIQEHYIAGEERAITAINVYVHQLIKHIGAYAAVLNGLDALIFTGGVGENSSFIRKLVCQRLGYLGIELNEKANHAQGQEAVISSANSKAKVLVIPANEELMIAKDTYNLLQQANPKAQVA
ncbi:MAG: acetate kinase [Alphaproteobacteria bacterium]|nr:acetate kinase [Alphaproteobacteria bacterium]MBQ8677676.1 acetate kinase [Alphaproteobacteria bacterium]